MQGRIRLVIEQAAFTEYAEVDAVRVVKAIKDLQDKGQFKTTATANKYLEAFRAWTRWMLINDRWDRDPLATACKIKGDTSNTRPRTILSQEAFAQTTSCHANAAKPPQPLPANSGTGSI